MDTLELLKTRRSVKKYQSKKVEHELIEKIVEAGLFAASGKNIQCTKILVVEDEKLVRKLGEMNASILHVDFDPFYGAPVVIVVFADRNCLTHVEDGSLVMGNLMIEAHSLGVDSCWIHRAKEMFETSLGREIVRKLGIPDEYIGIGNCILGYFDGSYPNTPKRKENRVIYVK